MAAIASFASLTAVPQQNTRYGSKASICTQTHRASQSAQIRGSQTGLKVQNGMRVTCRKEGIHPEWHEKAQVICNGEVVMETSGTQESYNVDLWSGNHPFYRGNSGTVVTDEGRVNKFKSRFAGLTLGTVVGTQEDEEEK
ncbi:hypothetical protein CYMTET_39839 [Cymbomonas tetramitiformis]|uniref:50S ribosomal protein L31 n=1 Tax=Cymbomonas tetramitiformis TaxID=36881 RepID=A0AAE0CB24_9CHLO|nr:hypothetical protein CYMTET_39839 [Cymbomonas tetramitiformis]